MVLMVDIDADVGDCGRYGILLYSPVAPLDAWELFLCAPVFGVELPCIASTKTRWESLPSNCHGR